MTVLLDVFPPVTAYGTGFPQPVAGEATARAMASRAGRIDPGDGRWERW